MKKLMFILSAVAGLTLFGGETVDTFDVKISTKTAVADENYVCDYKGENFTGKLEVTYDDDGAIADTTCFLTSSRTKEEKEYFVTFNCGTVCGKKMNVATVVATFDCEDGSQFVCAGKGCTFVARKSTCNFCGGTPSCSKVKNVSGNVAGYKAYDCAQIMTIKECGSVADGDFRTACFGSFTLKYNKKESSL